jgi:predicted dehydrogenase
MHQINTALCSYGMSGVVFHGPLLEAHPGYKISKILERNRNDSKGKHPGSEIVRDYTHILEDPGIELVVINTPDPLHFEMCKRAIEAGKHVVVEKPFTLKAADADILIDLAKQKNITLSVFHNRRWDGDFLTIKQLIESGKLGRLVDFESHFDRFRNYIQESWKDQSNGTGTLFNLGSHLVDQALTLFGLPDRLFCDSRLLRDGAKTDDSYDLFLHYPKFKCLLRSSYLVKEPGPRFILHGSEGSFLKWGMDRQEADLAAGLLPNSSNWGEESESLWGTINTTFHGEELVGTLPTVPGNYLAYYENVYGAIRRNQALQVSAEQARDVIRIIEAAYQSSAEGQVVYL